ncbi:PAN2-PAN3 deadenylation complex catalytic subunit PAN2-like isoform X2 [Corticium candelabrum]|uniref:PAN2-PAN3 deadenylation complex catalytic subunit PAN2-like isoform X2 n=1 Tax=Corticium candelabrum TaxID=121492 RepID=UPI002E31685E|nr:PAN2-PAN3 deadenylation complex catalytic subunit PAN2-like isoform X2 [Corticium candelabrum]
MEYAELKVNVCDGADQFSVSSVTFDAFEELVWVGNQGGHVTSYYSIGLDKYTAFQAHHDEVRHIASVDSGLLTVSANTIKLTSRQGLQQSVMQGSETNKLEELQCAVKYENNSVLVGGHQHKLLQIDINKWEISQEVDTDEETIILRQSPRLICGGDSMGKITLRDARTLQSEHVFHCHTGALSDFDICGNLLVSCGFSSRYGQLSADRHLVTFDLRAMKTMTPVVVPIEPAFVRFVPAFTSRLAAVSQAGQLVLCDPSSGAHVLSNSVLMPILLEGLFCFAMDISSTGQALFIADSTGVVHLLSSNDQPFFNSYSNSTIFADPPMPLPYIDFDDMNVPLSVVPLPVTSRPLVSDWPESLSKMIRRPPPKVDPEILKTMKVVDGIGRAPNAGNRRRNQVPYDMKPFVEESDDDDEEDVSSLNGDCYLTGIPKKYCSVDMMSMDGVDFLQDKRCIFAGLERNNGPNTYCNAVLQLLYFVEPVRCVMESHVCHRESCLSCELGFLFNALDFTTQKSCEVSNLIQVFQSLPEAAALGLVLSEKNTGKPNLVRLSQSWSRFILQQISKDAESDNCLRQQSEEGAQESSNLSVIEKIFSMELDTQTRCRCGKKSNRSLTAMQLMLNYPRARNGELLQLNEKVPFSHLLENSLQKEQTTQAWCDQCNKYKTHSQTRQVHRLPDVMLISCLDDAKDFLFWKSQQQLRDADNGSSVYWLPVSIRVSMTESGELSVHEGNDGDEEESSVQNDGVVIFYDLMAVVSYVEAPMVPGHLVAHILPSSSQYTRRQEEVLKFSDWRVPCHLCFTRRDLNDHYNMTVHRVTDVSLLRPVVVNKAASSSSSTVKPLQSDEALSEDTLVAVGIEFVSLRLDQSECSVSKAGRLLPARVTIIRGDGSLEGVSFIDDYIARSEQNVEFLAQFCGVKPGDLEPAVSSKPLTLLKAVYLKLRCLRDLGVKFIGYGLRSDFHLLNFQASAHSLLDISELFHLSGEINAPLRFMAWYFLGIHVQTTGRNSTEDAQTALKLYRKYRELNDDPTVNFTAAVQRLYKAGRQNDWVVPA